jgi:small nuclear ribonucleoprotein (snRNP)-like protein
VRNSPLKKRQMALFGANNSSYMDMLLSTGQSFNAPLTTTTVLQRGTGGATFGRATTATVEDFEGLLKPVLSGEVRFQGARRVYNLCPTPSTSISVAGNKTITAAVGTYVFSMGAESTGTCLITFTGTATGSSGTLTANASSRTSKTLTITSAGTIIATCTVAAAADIQFENVTGQANQNPSEYVSVGVLSSPYHGAMVDGVKYFDYENGNTVASNIVSEAQGAGITVDGYLAEGARTNLCLQSETFGTTWTPTGSTVSSDATTAPDGTTTADKIVENTATSLHGIYQSVTITIAPTTWSVYLKAAERTWGVVNAYDGFSNLTFFDLSNGVVGTNAVGNTATIEALPNGWYRCTVERTPAGTGGYFEIYTASADNTATYLGDGASGIYVWGGQIETAAFASTYIPTTTAAVTRNADVLAYATAGNFSDTAGTMYAEAAQVSWSNIAGSIVGSATQGMMPLTTNSGVKGYDGTNTVNGTAGAPSGVVKMAVHGRVRL